MIAHVTLELKVSVTIPSSRTEFLGTNTCTVFVFGPASVPHILDVRSPSSRSSGRMSTLAFKAPGKYACLLLPPIPGLLHCPSACVCSIPDGPGCTCARISPASASFPCSKSSSAKTISFTVIVFARWGLTGSHVVGDLNSRGIWRRLQLIQDNREEWRF